MPDGNDSEPRPRNSFVGYLSHPVPGLILPFAETGDYEAWAENSSLLTEHFRQEGHVHARQITQRVIDQLDPFDEMQITWDSSASKTVDFNIRQTGADNAVNKILEEAS